MAKETSKNAMPHAGLLFVAFMFLGVGIGNIMGNTGAGTLIGMGIGFLGMFYAKNKSKQ